MSHQKSLEPVHRKGEEADSDGNDGMDEIARKFASVMSLNSSKGLEDFDDDDGDAGYLRLPDQWPLLSVNLFSPSLSDNFIAAKSLRHFLAGDHVGSRIDAILKVDMLTERLMFFVRASDMPKLQYEAAWIITNLATGTTSQTESLASTGIIQTLTHTLMTSPHLSVKTQIVWALANIAGDEPHLRVALLSPSNNVIAAMLKTYELIKNGHIIIGNGRRQTLEGPNEDVMESLRVLMWAFSNVCRGGEGTDWKNFVDVFNVLMEVIYVDDIPACADACWALSRILSGTHKSEHLYDQMRLDVDVFTRLLDLCANRERTLITPVLRALINVASGPNKLTTVLLRANPLPTFRSLLTPPTGQPMTYLSASIRRDTLLCLANIAAGEEAHGMALVRCDGLLERVSECVIVVDEKQSWDLDEEERRDAEWKVVQEAVWVLSNLVQCVPADGVCEFLHSTSLTPVLPRLLRLLNEPSTPQAVLAKTLDTLYRIVKFAPPTIHLSQQIRFPECHDVVTEFVDGGGLDIVWTVLNAHRRSPRVKERCEELLDMWGVRRRGREVSDGRDSDIEDDFMWVEEAVGMLQIGEGRVGA